MNFKNWSDAKEKAHSLDLYTKAYLKELYNMKPNKDASASKHKVYTGGKWRVYDFYSLKDAIEIKKLTKKELVEYEINEENICVALYIINKSAKKSRDTKVDNYNKGNYSVVSKSKTRENSLYSLKDKVIEKAVSEGFLKLIGYHAQFFNNIESNLLLYKSEKTNMTFHIPVNETPKVVNLLGNIEEKISSKVDIKINMKYSESILLLEKFIEQ